MKRAYGPWSREGGRRRRQWRRSRRARRGRRCWRTSAPAPCSGSSAPPRRCFLGGCIGGCEAFAWLGDARPNQPARKIDTHLRRRLTKTVSAMALPRTGKGKSSEATTKVMAPMPREKKPMKRHSDAISTLAGQRCWKERPAASRKTPEPTALFGCLYGGEVVGLVGGVQCWLIE